MSNTLNSYAIKPEVLQAASVLGVPASALHEVIHGESNHNPKAVNYQGGKMYAVGLIQFVAKTAASLGTTLAALYGMSYAQQMLYVVKYYQQFGKAKLAKVKDGFDLYCLTFWPAWFAAPDTAALPDYAARLNMGVDVNKDGKVTKADFRKWFAKRLQTLQGYSPTPDQNPKKKVFAVLIVVGFTWSIYKLLKTLF